MYMYMHVHVLANSFKNAEYFNGCTATMFIKYFTQAQHLKNHKVQITLLSLLENHVSVFTRVWMVGLQR